MENLFGEEIPSIPMPLGNPDADTLRTAGESTMPIMLELVSAG